MPIIDAHVHVGDKYQPMAPFEDTGRVDRLLYLMDECGVEKAVMVPVVAKFSPDNNAECARWAREHPERLANMVDVAMHDPGAATAIARAREEFGAMAISYYPNSADIGWMLDPQHQTLWQALAASDLPCNLHVTPPNYPVLLELARRHSDLRFVCNHLGLPSTTLDPSDATYGGPFRRWLSPCYRHAKLNDDHHETLSPICIVLDNLGRDNSLVELSVSSRLK